MIGSRRSTTRREALVSSDQRVGTRGARVVRRRIARDQLGIAALAVHRHDAAGPPAGVMTGREHDLVEDGADLAGGVDRAGDLADLGEPVAERRGDLLFLFSPRLLHALMWCSMRRAGNSEAHASASCGVAAFGLTHPTKGLARNKSRQKFARGAEFGRSRRAWHRTSCSCHPPGASSLTAGVIGDSFGSQMSELGLLNLGKRNHFRFRRRHRRQRGAGQCSAC